MIVEHVRIEGDHERVAGELDRLVRLPASRSDECHRLPPKELRLRVVLGAHLVALLCPVLSLFKTPEPAESAREPRSSIREDESVTALFRKRASGLPGCGRRNGVARKLL